MLSASHVLAPVAFVANRAGDLVTVIIPHLLTRSVDLRESKNVKDKIVDISKKHVKHQHK
mgnify:CR=1 FL=1